MHFLDRYEWPSLWETMEVQEHLSSMWSQSVDVDLEEQGETGPVTDVQDEHETCALDPSHCPDRGKMRANVGEYVAIIGEDVAVNLEGLALARLLFSPVHLPDRLLLLRQRPRPQPHLALQHDEELGCFRAAPVDALAGAESARTHRANVL